MAAAAEPVYTGTCDNMTFEEAYEVIMAGKPFSAVCCLTKGAEHIQIPCSGVSAIEGVISIRIASDIADLVAILYWTPDGISTVEPSSSGT